MVEDSMGRAEAFADLLYNDYLATEYMSLDLDIVAGILSEETDISFYDARELLEARVRENEATDEVLRIYPHEHLLKCIICGQPTVINHQRTYRSHWACCSAQCHKQLDAEVDRIVEERYPGLLDKQPLIVDPYVGDESAIAKLSARSRVGDALTFPLRWQIAHFYIELHRLPIKPGHVLILAERAAGRNSQEVLVNGKMYKFMEGGIIRRLRYNDGTYITPEKHYGYYYERVEGGWQEHRPDDDPWPHAFISDSQMKAPEYGDIEGTTLSIVEHGFAATWE